MRILVPTLAAAGALAVAALAPAQVAAAPGGWQLPDLEQEPPSGLVLTSGALSGHPGRYYLGFRSAVRNVGAGPLLISGRRASRRTPTMRATQLIQGAGGAVKRVPGVGRLRYVASPGHHHWHLLEFDRYTLRRVGSGKQVPRRDRKTGFCLGDRFRALAPLAAPASPTPTFTSNCGLGRPGRLTMNEGISVGYGDDYPANLEGQLIEITGLPDGRYELTHAVNSGHGLRELSYANNAASMLLSLKWLRGEPYVRVLASCEHTGSCTARSTSRAVVALTAVAAPRFHCRLTTAAS